MFKDYPKLKSAEERRAKKKLKFKEKEIKPDFVIKILLLGDSDTGKTNLINRYCYNKFTQAYRSNTVADYTTIMKELSDGKIVQCQIWEGQPNIDKHTNMGYNYMRGCDGVIFVADGNNAKSFENVQGYVDLFREEGENALFSANREKSAIKALAITKVDIENSRVVSDKRAQFFATSQNIIFAGSMSAKEENDDNLQELFDNIIEQAVAKALIKENTSNPGVYKQQLNAYLEQQLKLLPELSNKYKDLNKIKLELDDLQEKSEEALKSYVATIKGIVIQHRDTGLIGFFKATWARKTASYKAINEIFDDKNELKLQFR